MKKSAYIFSLLNTLPQITLMGEVNVPAPNKHFERKSDEWIAYIILDGSMKMKEEDWDFMLSAGDIFFFTPNKHHLGLMVNDNVHYFYIHFLWSDLKEIVMRESDYREKLMHQQKEYLIQTEKPKETDELLLPKHLRLSKGHSVEITGEFRRLLEIYQKAILHQQNLANGMFYMLLLKLSQMELQYLLPEANNTFSYALPVITYLKENYRRKISSVLLEKEFHHNFDYMNRKFKEATGKTIFRFLEEYRIEESKKMLESKQYSVSQIAEYLGFCNAFYFSKVFKKHENMTPSEYKQ